MDSRNRSRLQREGATGPDGEDNTAVAFDCGSDPVRFSGSRPFDTVEAADDPAPEDEEAELLGRKG